MALSETAKLVTELHLKDKLSKGILSAQRNLSGFDKHTSNTQKALGRAGHNLERFGVIAAGAATGGIVAVVRAAADYESAFAGVRKTVDASEDEFLTLSQGFRDLAKTIPVSAVELAGLGEQAGALGIRSSDILKFSETAAKLGVTTNLTADEAADALGRIGTILGFTGDDFGTFGSALVKLGNEGASTEAEIIEITKRFGAAGQSAGLSTDQILAYSSAIASAGVDQEAAGSSLSRLFGNLIQETATASKEGKAFAKVSGKSFGSFSALVEKDTNAAMLLFIESLSKLDKFEAARALKDVGITGVRDINAIRLLAETYERNLIPALGHASEAIRDTSAIDKEAGARFVTFDSQLQKLQNHFVDAGITIGTALLPKILPIFDRLSAFINANQGAIAKFGADLASGFGQFVDYLGAVNWTPLIEGLKQARDLAKGAVDLFLSLPKEAQAALVTGFALNKVTGGLPAAAAKDVLKFGAGQIIKAATAHVQAANVTVVGGNVTGGPGGGPGGPLGTVAKGGGLLAAAGGVAGLTSILAIAAPLALVAVAGAAARQNLTEQQRGEHQQRFTDAERRQRIPGGGLQSLVNTFQPVGNALLGALRTGALLPNRSGSPDERGEVAITNAIRAGNAAQIAKLEQLRLSRPIVNVSPTPVQVRVYSSARDNLKSVQTSGRYGRAIPV